jgi:hypothetical protein
MFEEEYENNKNNLSETIVIRNNPINIVQLDKNGHFIEEYDSLAKAQKNTKISANTILNKCKNGQIYKGCKWMFSKDYYSQNN